ncbi:MAG TPA: TfuA-like protein [Candidatus Binatia bacterium]|jgi:hypothetical protein
MAEASPAWIAPGEIVVFLGPTLAREAAEAILPARYFPPVACGDILRCLRIKPKVIAIIDGVFEHRASVWHKEILFALEQGITVFGAGSMGALRAAELAPFGMIGIGRIFESYRDGVYTDDDEVALLYESGAAGYRALSEPMVNIRATVARAVAAGVIMPRVGELVIACAKESSYQARSLRSAVEKAGVSLPSREPLLRLLQYVENGGHVDQKNLDALDLIRMLARLEVPPVSRRRVRTKGRQKPSRLQ